MVAVGVLALSVNTAWAAPSEPSGRGRADEQISQRFEVPIKDPATGVTYPSVVLVKSAHLDTRSPDGSGANAPKGLIYLTLTWSSFPVSHEIGTPLWYVFYANMTPLPATSIVYVAKGGREYTSTRVDAIDPSLIGDATQNDGLLNAKYFFTVPPSNREGTVEIRPSRTVGALFGPSGVNRSDLVLDVSETTRIPVHFTEDLVYVTAPNSASDPGKSTKSPLVLVIQLAVLAGATAALLHFIRRRKVLVLTATPALVVPDRSEDPPAGAYHFVSPQPTPTTVVSEKATASSPTDVSGVRISVLGHVVFDPSLGRCGEPARAILVYLALHTERPRSVDDVQTALYPIGGSGKDVARATFLNYVSEARKAIGARHLPEAVDGGYRLVDVSTDWDEFQALAKSFPSASTEEQLRIGAAAMDLIRDQPFTGELTRNFEWVYSERIVSHMQRVIAEFAFAFSSKQIRANDMAGAEATLRKGLLVAEASTTLWEQLTDVMLEHRDTSVMDQHWQQAESVLNPTVVRALRSRAQG